jgi:hypothetical protein
LGCADSRRVRAERKAPLVLAEKGRTVRIWTYNQPIAVKPYARGAPKGAIEEGGGN